MAQRQAPPLGGRAEILLFRHAQGATEGFRGFADELRAAGHVVHAPDLYEGRTFASLEEGVNHAREVGLGTILDADYDEGAASLLTQRVLAFLEDIE